MADAEAAYAAHRASLEAAAAQLAAPPAEPLYAEQVQAAPAPILTPVPAPPVLSPVGEVYRPEPLTVVPDVVARAPWEPAPDQPNWA
jgi:hypothetical protein